MIELGIMQGRLSPPNGAKIQSFPKSSWAEEFSRAASVGLTHIEWIFEADDFAKNPIATDEGCSAIVDTIRRSGVKVISLCADYFMDVPYQQAAESDRRDLREKLRWLVVQARRIGAAFIDLPFVDASKISGRDEFTLVSEFVSFALDEATRQNVTITLETSLAPQPFTELLTLFNHPRVMANYDTGNSSGIGYHCDAELQAYGKWIRTVHIKDRLLGGTTVPLGTGGANFPLFFESLASLKYSGPIVLQAAREKSEVDTAAKNVRFVKEHLSRVGLT